MKHMGFQIGILLLSLPLTACFQKSYHSPLVSVPARWQYISKEPLKTSGQNSWWKDFNDPILNDLIENQSLNNLQIKIAQQRVRIAESEYKASVAQLFPTLNATIMPPNGTGADLTQVLGVISSLDIDLFGKQYYTRQSKKAYLEASKAEQAFALLSLKAEIASSYIEFREAQARIKTLKKNIKLNQQIAIFLKNRLKGGLVNYTDTIQQFSLIEVQQGELQQTKSLLNLLLHKLEILTGCNPYRLSHLLKPYRPIPFNHVDIPLDIPAKLLQNRPDIIAAERRVAAAHANIQAAMANLFPQPTIGWILAWQTETISALLTAIKQPDSTFFGTLTAPILNINLHRIVNIQERTKALVALQYQLTVMQALHEVETEYTNIRLHEDSTSHFRKARALKQEVLSLLQNRFKKGLIDFSTLLHAEEELNRIEMLYLREFVILQTSKIKLYKALGGDIGFRA